MSPERGARPLAPFGRRSLVVATAGEVGPYTVISLRDPGGPVPVAGQFYMLAGEDNWGGEEDGRPYLGRAFSVSRVHEGDPLELEFFLESVGPGTRRLAQLRPGDGVHVNGPFGNGYVAPGDDVLPLLVGGGIGVAPLLVLSDALGENGRVLLGFRSADHAQAAGLFKHGAAIATDDGSAGHGGFVTELLVQDLDQFSGKDHPVEIYACGPPPMLEVVRQIASSRGIAAQLALESGMACGFGACFGCAVPTIDGYIRLCVDGPVVAASKLESVLVPGAGH